MEKKRNILVETIIIIILGVFSVYKIHLGLHFDESINVAMGDMLLKGKGFLVENWTTLQFSGLFIAPFLWIYSIFFEGIVGKLLFLRYVYLIFQAMLAFFTFKTIRKHTNRRNAWLAGLCVFVYVFSWQAITYKSILFWGCLLMILCFIRYYDTDKVVWLLLAAVSLCIAVLGFSGAVLMLVPAVYLSYQKDHSVKPGIIFIFVCFILACLVLGYASAGNTVEEVLFGMKQVLNADAYSESMLHKVIRIGGSLVIISTISIALYVSMNKLLNRFVRNKSRNVHFLMTVILLIFLFVMCVARIESISASRVWYALMILFVWIPFDSRILVDEGRMHEEKRKWMLTFFYWPSVFMIASIMIATNQYIVPTIYGGILGLIGIVAVYPIKNRKIELNDVAVILLVVSFFVFVPDQSGADKLLQKRECIDIGPARGIYVSEYGMDDYNRACNVVQNNVTDEDSLLITGNNFKVNGYLCTEADYGVYSPFNVSADAHKLYDYYWADLDRLPSIILYDTREGMDIDTWLESDIGKLFAQYFDLDKKDVYEDYYVLRRKRI